MDVSTKNLLLLDENISCRNKIRDIKHELSKKIMTFFINNKNKKEFEMIEANPTQNFIAVWLTSISNLFYNEGHLNIAIDDDSNILIVNFFELNENITEEMNIQLYNKFINEIKLLPCIQQFITYFKTNNDMDIKMNNDFNKFKEEILIQRKPDSKLTKLQTRLIETTKEIEALDMNNLMV